jgi:hypothetical protein
MIEAVMIETAMLKGRSLIAACTLLLGATAAANASSYVVTIDQVGSNVVATGSGEFDLTGLTSCTGCITGGRKLCPISSL